jgi:hypothetical protein
MGIAGGCRDAMGIEAGAGALKTSVSVIIRAQIAPLATSIWGGSFTQAPRTPEQPIHSEAVSD